MAAIMMTRRIDGLDGHVHGIHIVLRVPAA